MENKLKLSNFNMERAIQKKKNNIRFKRIIEEYMKSDEHQGFLLKLFKNGLPRNKIERENATQELTKYQDQTLMEIKELEEKIKKRAIS